MKRSLFVLFLLFICSFGYCASSLDFNGTTSLVDTSYTSTPTIWSVMVWARAEGNGEGNLGRYYDKNLASNLRRSNSGTVFNVAYSTTNGAWTIANPALNEWHHVAATYDSTSNSNDPVLYVDGVSQSFTGDTNPVGTLTSNTQSWTIGNRNSATVTWDGQLAFFRAYDRILTVQEINQEMRCPGSIVEGLIISTDLLSTSDKDSSGDNVTLTYTSVSDSSFGPPVSFCGGSK
jgi:hypothetical protein